MGRLWPGSFVEESNLSQNIYLLRKAPESMASGEPLIESFRRSGYCFNSEIRVREATPPIVEEGGRKESLNEFRAHSGNLPPPATHRSVSDWPSRSVSRPQKKKNSSKQETGLKPERNSRVVPKPKPNFASIEVRQTSLIGERRLGRGGLRTRLMNAAPVATAPATIASFTLLSTSTRSALTATTKATAIVVSTLIVMPVCLLPKVLKLSLATLSPRSARTLF
jgi:hypothetical protein